MLDHVHTDNRALPLTPRLPPLTPQIRGGVLRSQNAWIWSICMVERDVSSIHLLLGGINRRWIDCVRKPRRVHLTVCAQEVLTTPVHLGDRIYRGEWRDDKMHGCGVKMSAGPGGKVFVQEVGSVHTKRHGCISSWWVAQRSYPPGRVWDVLWTKERYHIWYADGYRVTHISQAAGHPDV